MDSATLSVAVAVAAYALVCLVIGVRSAAVTANASDFHIAGRNVSVFAYATAVTAAAFSGWTFISHPALIYAEGFQYAFVSLYAITIPLTAVIFFKRQWLLGKRFGFVTPGDMYANYFRSEGMRVIVFLVAVIIAVPIIAIQFHTTGTLVSFITDGRVTSIEGMWLLSAIVIAYATLGGMEAAARIGTFQFVFMWAGIVGLGLYVGHLAGGIEGISQAIGLLATIDTTRTPDDFSHYVAAPGVIQWVASGPAAQGGEWTAAMVLSYVAGFMGIMAAPAFTMWAFAAGDPRAQGHQQVWGSAFLMGGALIGFAAIIGITPHVLGADPLVNFNARDAALVQSLLPELRSAEDQSQLVLFLIRLVGEAYPFAVGALVLAALAAIQSTAATFITTTGAMASRDIVQSFLIPSASGTLQIMTARIFMLVTSGAALLLATFGLDWAILAGSIAVAIALQMWPALIAVCYVPWITRSAVILGLGVGILAVVATEKMGGQLAAMFGYALPWGRWPLTIHSALWGIGANLITVIVISAITQSRPLYEHRARFQSFLRDFGEVGRSARLLMPIGFVLTLAWLFFAIGPGLIIGNTLFGDPNDPDTWRVLFGMPSIWIWQLIAWASGVLLIWFLAFRLRLAGRLRTTLTPLTEDIGSMAVRTSPRRGAQAGRDGRAMGSAAQPAA